MPPGLRLRRTALRCVRIFAGCAGFSERVLLPHPTTQELGEDQGEGLSAELNVPPPPLPAPWLARQAGSLLFHRMEERE